MPLCCICPEDLGIDEPAGVQSSPMHKTPMDSYGFQPRCCRYIPLKSAAFIICIITFFWAACELVSSEKFMLRIFPDKGDVFEIFKVFHMVASIGLAVASGVLMIGILTDKYQWIHVFVWYGFLFLLIFVGLSIAGTTVGFMNGLLKKKRVFKIVMAVFWCFLYCYFLIVVNSYRITMWILFA